MPNNDYWNGLHEIGMTLFAGKTAELKAMSVTACWEKCNAEMPEKMRRKEQGWHQMKALHTALLETLKMAEEEERAEAGRQIDRANTKSTIEASLQQRLDHPTAADEQLLSEHDKLMAGVPIRVMPEPAKARAINTSLPPFHQMLDLIISQCSIQELLGVQNMVDARWVEMIGHAKQQATAAIKQEVKAPTS